MMNCERKYGLIPVYQKDFTEEQDNVDRRISARYIN